MKITVSCLLFLFILQTQLISQPLYLKFQGGYGLGTAPGTLYSFDGRMDVTESNNYSFGQGTYYGLSLGYYITNNAAIDMEFNYHTGSAFTYYENSNTSQFEFKRETELAGNAFSIIPSLLITTEFLSVNPYLKVGAIISFPGITEKQTTQIIPGVQSSIQSAQYIEYSYTGGLTFGVASAMGLMYGISDGINISLEVNNKNISYAPKDGKIEKATLNGVTILEQISPEYLEFEFVDTIEHQSDNESSTRLTTQYPFSSLSFLMGISIEL